MLKIVNFGLLCVYAATSFAMTSGQSNLQGKMYGGQQPVVGAHVYLFSPAQSTTFGSASVSLITPGSPNTMTDAIGTYFLTDGQGRFQINGQYTCTPNVPIYFYVSMGDAGYGANNAIANMAYLGVCGNINSQTFTLVNEATTVAQAYAVAGYATDPLHISYSGTPASLTGIQNAFANADNLVNPVYGTANSTIPSGYATAPQATLNTIANALASCINETTQGANTSNCSTLFSATSVNGVAPTTTAAAAMNIAHNPASSTAVGIQNGTNIAAIMTLSQAYVQFTPVLAAAPNDFTLGVTFSGSGIANPSAIAIDGSGNAWIASLRSSNAGASVVEIANPTSMQTNNNTYPVSYIPQDQAYSIAVDAGSNNIWIGTGSAVEEINNAGVPASGSPFLATDSNFGGGYALNLDSTGNVWIAAYQSVYELSATGAVLSPITSPCGAGYCLPAGGNAVPSALALDASNNVWITDYVSNTLNELNSQGLLQSVPSSVSLNSPNSVAIDAQHNIWIANNGAGNYSNGVDEYIAGISNPYIFYTADTPSPSAPSAPTLLFAAIDGAGTAWSSLSGAYCFTTTTACVGVSAVSSGGKLLTGPGYTIDGYQSYGSELANATAIDGSGNVWVLNTQAQSVTELIGAAAPVVTPLAVATSTNSLGARP